MKTTLFSVLTITLACSPHSACAMDKRQAQPPIPATLDARQIALHNAIKAGEFETLEALTMDGVVLDTQIEAEAMVAYVKRTAQGAFDDVLKNEELYSPHITESTIAANNTAIEEAQKKIVEVIVNAQTKKTAWNAEFARVLKHDAELPNALVQLILSYRP